jgi:hypothetical protein
VIGIIGALGASDCEVVDAGWLAQPANALSSLAYTVVGIVLIPWAFAATGTERGIRVIIGVGAMATGIGSLLYHGPQGWGSHFAHDVTFLLVLIVIGVADIASGVGWTAARMWALMVMLIGVAVTVLMIVPGATNVLTVSSVALVVVGDIAVHRGRHRRQPWYAIAIGTLAFALLAFALGRTGGPLCDGDSLLQGHAAWHILGAVGIGAYAVATGAVRGTRDALR